ncbi:ras-related C3 botulinum toxin substrate 3-like [Acanthaster planci]|uniref:Ras-related C3 botulinum toxin substrate 3-like n=1 Tax=Acanthaster planci TaxID=133434 RepID=A0A8B7XPR7_ACAPL|nr:ras-related C3 botulinum toxin substrate 3-like [Acanthaster planci]
MPNKKEDGVQLKVLFEGDGGVGKTCLCISLYRGYFPRSYIPTNFDRWPFETVIAGKTFNPVLVDESAGGEDIDRLRPLSYPGTDLFLMCFSVECRSSFEHVESRWLPEIRHHMPTTPILLVATKIDLRGSPQYSCVTFDEGFKLAQKHNWPYIETSALLHSSERSWSSRPRSTPSFGPIL